MFEVGGKGAPREIRVGGSILTFARCRPKGQRKRDNRRLPKTRWQHPIFCRRRPTRACCKKKVPFWKKNWVEHIEKKEGLNSIHMYMKIGNETLLRKWSIEGKGNNDPWEIGSFPHIWGSMSALRHHATVVPEKKKKQVGQTGRSRQRGTSARKKGGSPVS